jgi:dynein heavy chain, axonemal
MLWQGALQPAVLLHDIPWTVQAIELMTELNAAAGTAEGVNNEERMFGWGISKYDHIAKTIYKLEPFYSLWTTAFEFYDKSAKWLNQPFKDVVAEEVEEAVADMFRKMYKLTKTFSGVASEQQEPQAPLKVAIEVCSHLFFCTQPIR